MDARLSDGPASTIVLKRTGATKTPGTAFASRAGTEASTE